MTSLDTTTEISTLIAELGDENGLTRQRARLNLGYRGNESIPELLKAIHSPNTNTRLGAIKVLGELHATEAAQPLVPMLMDDDPDIRWSTMESLIRVGRVSMRPILEMFIRNFDSSVMREGVHHILHAFKDQYILNEYEITLFKELDKQRLAGFQMGWNSEAAWAAEKALEVLDKMQNE